MRWTNGALACVEVYKMDHETLNTGLARISRFSAVVPTITLWVFERERMGEGSPHEMEFRGERLAGLVEQAEKEMQTPCGREALREAAALFAIFGGEEL